MGLPYWMGGFLIEVIRRGGIGAGVIVLLLIVAVIGGLWLLRHYLTERATARAEAHAAELERIKAKADLSRERFEADQAHVRKLEAEGAEWRKFLGNHMEHFLQEMKDITVGIQAISDSHSRFAAKQIEGMNLLNERIAKHASESEKSHETIKKDIDELEKTILESQIKRNA